jgi:hypothetical protein
MNGTMMDIVEDHEYGGDTSTSNGGSTTYNNNNNNTRRRRGTGTPSSSSSSNGLDFSDTVESILAALEKRGDNHDPHHGPLNRTEMSKLSMLCSQQQQQQQTIKANGNNDKTRIGGQVVLNEDLGFADVDVELVGELVEFLEKHVALASNINIIQSSYDIVKKIKSKGARYSNFDEVRCAKTKTLVGFTDQGLKYV